MTVQQGVQLPLAESVVDRHEGDARQSGSEQGDGIGELVGAEMDDGLMAPEAVGGGMGAVQQFGVITARSPAEAAISRIMVIFMRMLFSYTQSPACKRG
jgi:hypothetical protein